MIPGSWSAPLTTYLWQAALHSAIMGFIFYVWVHRLRVPSGRTKQRLLGILLVLPMVTAAIPRRGSVEFAERIAWLNSARILAVPLPGGFHVSHLAMLVGLVVAAATIVQEVLPLFRSVRSSPAPVPLSLAALVRSRPGWEHCVIAISPLPSVMLATAGVPGRPRVIVSRGAIDMLTPEELDVVVAHEHAHWGNGSREFC